MQDAPEIEGLLRGEDGAENLQVGEDERQAGQDEDAEGDDEEDVLEPLGAVHPQELLVVADEGRRAQCFVHRVLILWKRSAAMKSRNAEINPAMRTM